MWREKWREPVRRRALECRDVAGDLAETVDDAGRLGKRQQRHAEHCLRCQAHVAQHRRMARALQGLRQVTVQPDVDFLTEVMAGLDELPEQRSARAHLSGRRIAYAGGLAAATAAGAVSAVVLTARSRRARLAG